MNKKNSIKSNLSEKEINYLRTMMEYDKTNRITTDIVHRITSGALTISNSLILFITIITFIIHQLSPNFVGIEIFTILIIGLTEFNILVSLIDSEKIRKDNFKLTKSLVKAILLIILVLLLSLFTTSLSSPKFIKIDLIIIVSSSILLGYCFYLLTLRCAQRRFKLTKEMNH